MRRHGCLYSTIAHSHFIGFLVIYQVQLAYNVSYWQVKTVIDHSECSPPSCNIKAAKNEKHCLPLHVQIYREIIMSTVLFKGLENMANNSNAATKTIRSRSNDNYVWTWKETQDLTIY